MIVIDGRSYCCGRKDEGRCEGCTYREDPANPTNPRASFHPGNGGSSESLIAVKRLRDASITFFGTLKDGFWVRDGYVYKTWDEANA